MVSQGGLLQPLWLVQLIKAPRPIVIEITDSIQSVIGKYFSIPDLDKFC